MIRLIVDQNIPLAAEAFSQFGDVRLMPGRDLKREDVAAADALIVRSITKVNSALLAGTPVRFVGTATIGTDHLDIPWLDGEGIRWASAQGCNAFSVVEWVFAALAEQSLATGRPWWEGTLGIVGHGNIGSRLAHRARRLGMKVLICDPPQARRGQLADHLPLRELLAHSDFVTVHVPLVRNGEDRTVHLLGASELALLRPGAVLLNASRGDVIDNAAAVALRDDVTLILDVFEGEPRPRVDVLRRCFLATPHIAGYSHEGKVNGTTMMAEAVAAWLGKASTWAPKLAPPAVPVLPTLAGLALHEAMATAIRHSYPIREDDAKLRGSLDLDDAARGAHFDALRRDYHQRREFPNYQIPPGTPDPLAEKLRAIGFAG